MIPESYRWKRLHDLQNQMEKQSLGVRLWKRKRVVAQLIDNTKQKYDLSVKQLVNTTSMNITFTYKPYS